MLTVQANQDYMLFDGDCGVCTWASEAAKRMDGGRQFVIEPYQMFAESELMRLGISHEQCTKKLQVITRRGHLHQGALGVNYFLWKQFPWTLLVMLIYALPVLLALELIGYRLVAQNRHRISAWLGLTACKLRQ